MNNLCPFEMFIAGMFRVQTQTSLVPTDGRLENDKQD